MAARSWQAEAAELRRVLQRRLATEDAVRLAPFPAAVARVAIERAAVTGPAELGIDEGEARTAGPGPHGSKERLCQGRRDRAVTVGVSS